MADAQRCPACGFESDSFPELACQQCGKKFVRSGAFSPVLPRLAMGGVVIGGMAGFMFAFHFPGPMMVFSGLITFLMAAIGLRRRWSPASIRNPVPRPMSSWQTSQPISRQIKRPMSAIVLDLSIGILGLAFLCCLLFGFVAFANAHMAVERVQGQPYHAATFQVIRPYYQKSPGFHGPYISAYASGIVEGKKEWMDLFPIFKRYPRDQAELNELLPPGTVIPVYLFPNLKGRMRIGVIDVLPPGEASRRTEASVLRRGPAALAVLGGLIFMLVRMRRAFGYNRAASADQAMTASSSG